MPLFDKHVGEETKKSLEFAEAARQEEWESRSFVANIFQGILDWKMIHPFPEQSQKDKEEGDLLLNRLEALLLSKLNPDEVDITREIPKEVI